MFVDNVQVIIKAGDGGDGASSFRHERYVDRGGPDGGDGGDGGSIIFLASNNENTLASFRHNKKLLAENGQRGSKQKKHGKNGADLEIKVPVGTVISEVDGDILADLTKVNQRVVISKGGRGGFGNAHFVASARQAPKFAEKGERVEPINVVLELKTIADVGLVGLPNAGKSTLLAALSEAKPTIADYPFTTLIPNLGVLKLDDKSQVLFADIPGLIEGASEGKGLGYQFLRHIERTMIVVHIIDIQSDNLFKSYSTIQGELKAYRVDLSKRPQMIVLNKTDQINEANVKSKIAKLKSKLPKSTPVYSISALNKDGLELLISAIKKTVSKQHKKEEKLESSKDKIPILTLKDTSDKWEIVKTQGGFNIKGRKIEQFASRSDFDNPEGVDRLRDIMKKMGIMHELQRLGARSGDVISFSNYGNIEY